ncbi:hypothetical protein KUTeg_006922 [Tegillarca granosa]|uniref:Uncharacterized protein n=1 Tax=Tegillarca granosa TaxID=220873 RepID=A0ABQ9FFY2_TEGGR|nr:hypothetical protein KUTeg_006922 [Tegillarca granosa]
MYGRICKEFPFKQLILCIHGILMIYITAKCHKKLKTYLLCGVTWMKLCRRKNAQLSPLSIDGGRIISEQRQQNDSFVHFFVNLSYIIWQQSNTEYKSIKDEPRCAIYLLVKDDCKDGACTYLASWEYTPGSSDVVFEVQYIVSNVSDSWAAIAFSTTPTMQRLYSLWLKVSFKLAKLRHINVVGEHTCISFNSRFAKSSILIGMPKCDSNVVDMVNNSVIACIANNGQVSVAQSYNTDHDNQPIINMLLNCGKHITFNLISYLVKCNRLAWV